MRHITHIVFDLDGVLLDTQPFYNQVVSAMLARFGHTYTWDMQSRVMGKVPIDSARLIVDELRLPMTPEAFVIEREARLESLFPLSKPMFGAEELTRRLSALGVPQAIASSSTTANFALKTQRHREWFTLFQPIVLGDDPAVRAGKPAPDIYLAAAKRMGADPVECLVFEDAINGVESALAAGMAVIAVPDPRTDRARFAAADQVLESLTQFDPALWKLPVKAG